MSDKKQDKGDMRKRKGGRGKISESERVLEGLLFGTSRANIVIDTESPAGKKRRVKEEDSSAVKAEVDVKFEQGGNHDEEEDEKKPVSRAAAWADDDDEEVEIDISASNRLKKFRTYDDEASIKAKDYENRLRSFVESQTTEAAQSWAALPVAEEQTDENEGDIIASKLLSSNTGLTYVGGKRGSSLGLSALPAGKLNIIRQSDANIADATNNVVTNARFHQNGELFFTASMDKTLRLFQIDGERNQKVQSIVFPDLPIYCARYCTDSEIIVGGRRPFLYTYDMVQGVVTKVPKIHGRDEKAYEYFEISHDGKIIAVIGTDGCILLLNGKTKQLMNILRAHIRVASISFNHDDSLLYATCGDGKVLVFNLKTNTLENKFQDEGAVHGTVISSSMDGGYIATGSDSGILNIYDSILPSKTTETNASDYYNYYAAYDTNASVLAAKKPLKSVESLTTAISKIAFSPSSEIVAYASRNIRDQLKLVHLPSMTVFSNWPTDRTPLGCVQDIDFSPNTGMVSIANDKGKVLLYRLGHYGAI